MYRLLFSFVVLMGVAGSVLAQKTAEKRVALVVGVDSYASLQKLANPKRDAGALKAVLDLHKYDATFVADPDYKAFLKALAEFKRKARGADEALVYYAGHGMEAVKDGISQNILAPTDAEVSCETREALYVVTLNQLFEAMEGVERRIVILDACRKNPFRTSGARAASAGFGFRAALPQSQSVSRSLLVFSTDLGALASDGAAGQGSPFAAALVARLKAEPRLPYRELFERVAGEVAAGGQKPWVVGIGGTVEGCLAGTGCGAAAAPVVQPVPPAAQSAAAEAWPLVKDSTSVTALEAFIRRFGDTFHGDLAKGRLADVKQAEAQRQQLALLEQQKQETVRKQADAVAAVKKQADTEAAKKAAEARARDSALGVTPGSGQSFRDCADVCPEMVVLPAGEFTMGSNEYNDEKPPHKVTIAKPFAVGKFEVTFAEWDACVAGGGCAGNKSPKDENWGRGRRPVIDVSWNDAKAYVTWLSGKTRKNYRLLSEAEWEYAARAGTTTAYSFGNSITKAQAQFSEGSYGSAKQTVEVGRFPANAWGLHDMHGNVWEWVEDNRHAEDYKGAPHDGSVWPGGNPSFRVLRGGCWVDEDPDILRSAFRGNGSPDSRSKMFGVRVARKLD